MSEQIRQESPLVERITDERRSMVSTDAGVTLKELPFLGYLNLRGDMDDSTFTNSVREVTGIDLPRDPNTFVTRDRCSAIWLGPDEWYVVTPAGEENEVMKGLEETLSGQHFAVNDLTSGLTTINISGIDARALLQKGCTLDLHPRVFEQGQCAQTLLGKSGVLILHRGEEPSFDLVVRRSFADYVFLWIEDAAHEFGLAVA